MVGQSMVGQIHIGNGFSHHSRCVVRVYGVRAAARNVGVPGPSREVVEVFSLRGVVYLELDEGCSVGREYDVEEACSVRADLDANGRGTWGQEREREM